jgi:hypothetical protein
MGIETTGSIDPQSMLKNLVSMLQKKAESKRISVSEMRLLVILLALVMPAKGLPELTDTVAEMYEFYSYVPETSPVHQLPPASIEVEVSKTIIRPSFTIDLDEV